MRAPSDGEKRRQKSDIRRKERSKSAITAALLWYNLRQGALLRRCVAAPWLRCLLSLFFFPLNRPLWEMGGKKHHCAHLKAPPGRLWPTCRATQLGLDRDETPLEANRRRLSGDGGASAETCPKMLFPPFWFSKADSPESGFSETGLWRVRLCEKKM